MGNPVSKGRMIRKDISDSQRFAALSPHAAVLFCMIIPHLSSYGKLNGGPGFIKDEVCPRIKYLDLKTIEKSLKEISDKTNMKWFEHQGRFYIHAIHFLEEHQQLSLDRLGRDLLPSYSGVNPNYSGPTPPEVEVEEEGEGDKSPPPHSLFNLWNQIVKEPRATVMNKTRETKCRIRLKEKSLEDWGNIFHKLSDSSFCRGENDRGWRADFDWIIENDINYVKVLEGKYDGNKSNSPRLGLVK